MVAVLNAVGLDYCTFGNHEFDLKKDPFYQRLQESRFTWFSSNVFDANKQPFPGVSQNVVFTVKGESNPPVRVGLFGLTVNSNQATYVTYTAPIEAAKEQVLALKDKADILIAVTHLSLEQDMKLAETVPEIDLILGGHEHENIQVWRGPNFTPIFKADANVRSVYVHTLVYNTKTKRLHIDSRLQQVTDEIPEKPETRAIVDGWKSRAFDGFRKQGFEPEREVARVAETLDGREASVRNQPTNLTEIIAEAMLNAAPEVELAIFNSGSIRIDDELPAGPITEYDIIRIMPFSGVVVSVGMKGNDLELVLNAGQASKGSGAYLQTTTNTKFDNGKWVISGKSLAPNRSYQVAINDFLLTGNEKFNVSDTDKAKLASLFAERLQGKRTVQFHIEAGANSKALDRGEISGGLRQAFLDNKSALSQNITVSTKEKGSEWLITDNEAKKIYFVATTPYFVRRSERDLTISQSDSAALDNGTVSDRLRQAFKDSGIPLSQNVTVSTNREGSQWLITDNEAEKTYFLRKLNPDRLIINEKSKRLLIYQAETEIRKALIDQFKRK